MDHKREHVRVFTSIILGVILDAIIRFIKQTTIIISSYSYNKLPLAFEYISLKLVHRLHVCTVLCTILQMSTILYEKKH